MSRQIIIRCDHCNKDVGGCYYTVYIRMNNDVFKQELDLCNKCKEDFVKLMTDYIQPKHYKH